MRYLATIINKYDRTTMLFNTMTKAEQWLDENNNNLEHTTIIDEYDENWNKTGRFVYTEGKNNEKEMS